MATQIDKEGVQNAYEDVRSDLSETNWAVFKYEGNTIILADSGIELSELQQHFQDDVRAFAYVRILSGDEMSKRMKFALITFIGNDVGPIKKAKMSTDKALVKNIILNFAVEIQAETTEETSEEKIRELVIKAGGANYGTGS